MPSPLQTTWRPNRWSAIVSCKCPKCRQGKIFRSSAYDWSGFAKAQTECTTCGQDFRVEPGFYIGASYLHYGFTALVTTGAVLVDLAMGAFIPIWSLILAVLIANALLFPPCYRFSRSLMLHFFGSIVYDPKAIEEAPRIFVAADGHMQVLDGDDDLP